MGGSSDSMKIGYEPRELEDNLIAYLEEKCIGYETSLGVHYLPKYTYAVWVDVGLHLPGVYTKMWTNVLRPEIEHIARGYTVHFETQHAGGRKMDVQIYAMRDKP